MVSAGVSQPFSKLLSQPGQTQVDDLATKPSSDFLLVTMPQVP